MTMHPLAQKLEPNLRDTRHSATLLLNQASHERFGQAGKLFRFGFGQSPFPVPGHIADALRENAQRKEYIGVQGLPELREAIATFHSDPCGPTWTPDRVVIGAGSKILLYCLMAAMADAEVLLVPPCWVSYEPMARLAGHPVHYLRTRFEDRWRLSAGQLEQFCADRGDREKPLFLVLNYPGNPDGLTYSPKQLEALATVCRRHGVIVISDEIYGLLHHRAEHRSLSTYYPEGTIVTSGLSKWCGAGGWRLGVTHIPPALGEDYLQRVIGVCSETYSCAPAPVQHAAIQAYVDDERTDCFLQLQRDILSRLGTDCATALRQAGVRVHAPEGGFYLFPDFSNHADTLRARGITTSEQLTHRLLDQAGVALLPGSACAMPPDSLTARLAYVDFDGAEALADPTTMQAHMEEGINRLCAWLRGGSKS